MSHIKQVIRKSDLVQLPSVGAPGVMYIVPGATQNPSGESIIKGYYWDTDLTTYREIVDPALVVNLPYAAPAPYTQLNTIKKALDFLLRQDLAVYLTVVPSTVYTTDPTEISFSWTMNKHLNDIESMIIKNMTGSYALAFNPKDYTAGYSGSHSIQLTLTSDTVFEIEITDKDGNVATEQQTVLWNAQMVTIELFTVDPTEHYGQANNTIDVDFAWEVSDKDGLTALELQKNSGTGWTTIEEDMLQYTNAGGTGSLTISQTIQSPTEYRLRATSPGGVDIASGNITYYAYEPIEFRQPFTITPSFGYLAQDYQFSAELTKTTVGSGYIRLTQVTSLGVLVPKNDPKNVISSIVNNDGYYDATAQLDSHEISFVLNFDINEDVYFKLEVHEIDAYGNTETISESTVVTYEPVIQFTEMTFLPTKGYVGSTEYLAEATFNEVPVLANIESVSLVSQKDGSSLTNNVFNYTSGFANYFSGSGFSTQASTGVFNGAGNYTLQMRYKEIGMGAPLLSQSRTFGAQNAVVIDNMSIVLDGSDYKITALINKTPTLYDDNTYTFYEKKNDGEYTEVTGTITTGLSGGKRSVSFVSVNTFTVADSVTVKVVEDLGVNSIDANSIQATSEFEKTIDYSEDANVYWGAITEEDLNDVGYSIAVTDGALSTIKADYIAAVYAHNYTNNRIAVLGDVTDKFSVSDTIKLTTPGGNTVNKTITNVIYAEPVTLIYYDTPTPVGYEDLETVQKITGLSSAADLTNANIESILMGSAYVTDPSKVLSIGGTYGYESATQPVLKFQDRFGETPIENKYAWVAFPSADFNDFNQVQWALPGFEALASKFLKFSTTIGGHGYTIYIRKGGSTAGDHLYYDPFPENATFKEV